MKLIVGLGNVGDKYAGTRHNLGFMVVDELASQYNLNFSPNQKLRAEVAKGIINKQEAVLAKPTTMMNLSGQAVQKLAQFYKVASNDIWVIYDELDLEFGKVRIRDKGGSAGHNGVTSVVTAVGSDFIRWRVGTGKPEHKGETIDYVLRPFSESERTDLPNVITAVICSIEDSLETGEVEVKTLNTLL